MINARFTTSAFVACAAATPMMADELACVMTDGSDVAFTIDRNQFVDAISAQEPARRKVTTVTAADKTYPAEPFIIANTRGFHATGLGDASIMFFVGPDGRATYTNSRSGEKLLGICEDR